MCHSRSNAHSNRHVRITQVPENTCVRLTANSLGRLGGSESTHLQSELPQMVIRVFVGPALPVTNRHDSKESVCGFEGLWPRTSNPDHRREHALSIPREISGLRASDPWVLRRIGLPSVRPSKGRPTVSVPHRWVVPGCRAVNRSVSDWSTRFSATVFTERIRSWE